MLLIELLKYHEFCPMKAVSYVPRIVIDLIEILKNMKYGI